MVSSINLIRFTDSVPKGNIWKKLIWEKLHMEKNLINSTTCIEKYLYL